MKQIKLVAGHPAGVEEKVNEYLRSLPKDREVEISCSVCCGRDPSVAHGSTKIDLNRALVMIVQEVPDDD